MGDSLDVPLLQGRAEVFAICLFSKEFKELEHSKLAPALIPTGRGHAILYALSPNRAIPKRPVFLGGTRVDGRLVPLE